MTKHTDQTCFLIGKMASQEFLSSITYFRSHAEVTLNTVLFDPLYSNHVNGFKDLFFYNDWIFDE